MVVIWLTWYILASRTFKWNQGNIGRNNNRCQASLSKLMRSGKLQYSSSINVNDSGHKANLITYMDAGNHWLMESREQLTSRLQENGPCLLGFGDAAALKRYGSTCNNIWNRSINALQVAMEGYQVAKIEDVCSFTSHFYNGYWMLWRDYG